MTLSALRRDRAARTGPELFLHERAFADCLERIALVQRRFGPALLIGCPDPAWRERLRRIAGEVDVLEPGTLFAKAAGASPMAEEDWSAPPATYDLCLAVGTLDTVNRLGPVLAAIRVALRPDSLLIGAMSGGDTLPRLRSAMRSADQVAGAASAHVHPRIEASALAALLSAAGFAMPVVDVDRVPVSYESLRRLVGDLRRMGATNVLAERARRPMSRAERAAASEAFAAAGVDGRTVETFEILHFAAWAPASANHG